MIFILAILSIALFGLLSAMPGNPVDLLITSNPNVKPEDVARLRKLRGLDKPWYIQYLHWVWGYHEPAVPSKLLLATPITMKIQDDQIKVDLSTHLIDPNYIPNKTTLLELTKSLWPDFENSEFSRDIFKAIEKQDTVLLSTILAKKNANFSSIFASMINTNSSQGIVVQGLFGAKASGLTLTKKLDTDPRIWFTLTNSYGQQSVFFLTDERTSFLDPYPLQLPLPNQVVENDKKIFILDLKKFALENPERLHFRLLEEGPGFLSDDGIYRNKFEKEGQSVITFEVKKGNADPIPLAFSVEHGVIGNEKKFNRGFLFFFTGDQEALGFSQTYKRPVYELLFGPEVVCGNLQIDPGENCDDGNQKSGDGCGADCIKEKDNLISKAQIFFSGKIVQSGRIGNTLQLMLPALLLSFIVAIPVGILSAYWQYSWLDYLVNFLAFIGISLPAFWFGIMMIYLFAELFPILPAGGIQTPGIYEQGILQVVLDRFKYALLPTIVLSILFIGRWIRYMRSSMLEVLPSDYIRTARAKGLSEKVVIVKHAARNALIPVVTVITLSIPALFGGAVLTETVFSWPGIGRLQYEAILNSDYYVGLVVFLIFATLVMLANLLADVLYILIDPRIRKK